MLPMFASAVSTLPEDQHKEDFDVQPKGRVKHHAHGFSSLHGHVVSSPRSRGMPRGIAADEELDATARRSLLAQEADVAGATGARTQSSPSNEECRDKPGGKGEMKSKDECTAAPGCAWNLKVNADGGGACQGESNGEQATPGASGGEQGDFGDKEAAVEKSEGDLETAVDAAMMNVSQLNEKIKAIEDTETKNTQAAKEAATALKESKDQLVAKKKEYIAELEKRLNEEKEKLAAMIQKNEALEAEQKKIVETVKEASEKIKASGSEGQEGTAKPVDG